MAESGVEFPEPSVTVNVVAHLLLYGHGNVNWEK
jgi:hypothetical protein